MDEQILILGILVTLLSVLGGCVLRISLDRPLSLEIAKWGAAVCVGLLLLGLILPPLSSVRGRRPHPYEVVKVQSVDATMRLVYTLTASSRAHAKGSEMCGLLELPCPGEATTLAPALRNYDPAKESLMWAYQLEILKVDQKRNALRVTASPGGSNEISIALIRPKCPTSVEAIVIEMWHLGK